MNFAVIAAGEGSRLAQEGIAVPKPLVTLLGEPMLARLLRLFLEVGERLGEQPVISIIVNQQMTEVQQWLTTWQGAHPEVDLRVVVQSTPSSMHSMAELSRVLPQGKFVLTTVDTLFRIEEFASYVEQWQQMPAADADGCFAVTRFVDDEKPLWITTDDSGCITEFSDTTGTFVSGGVYGLDTRTALPVLHACLAAGQSRMRNYQRALVSAGLKLQACVFEKIMDVDHADDIRKAELWLRS